MSDISKLIKLCVVQQEEKTSLSFHTYPIANNKLQQNTRKFKNKFTTSKKTQVT
eukprot:m.70915 g.70915  ORF g.70915 m.70915 type:complete len:54 (+) comp12185_c0_seq1:825-986(+)